MEEPLTCSVIESREEVASSYTRIGAPFSTALAMATRCFSPPVVINQNQVFMSIFFSKSKKVGMKIQWNFL